MSVRQIQEWLNAHGFKDYQGRALQVDGAMGPRTRSAIRAFQTAANIAVDGIVGPQTTGAMNTWGAGGNPGGDTSDPPPLTDPNDPFEEPPPTEDPDDDDGTTDTPDPDVTDPPDVDPVDFYAQAQALMPWLPSELVQVYADAWIDTGSHELALAFTRQDSLYEQFFPGIRRQDGSFRMNEIEYMATIASFEDTLVDQGVNPAYFTSQFGQLITGEVSATEFRARVRSMSDRILTQESQLRDEFARLYGVEMSTEALMAAALDPTIGADILNRRISVAEIAGEAAIRGFQLNASTATRLFQTGFNSERAQELFRVGASLLPGIRRSARRQNEGDFGISDFIAAEGLGDEGEAARLRRILAGEQSEFGQGSFLSGNDQFQLGGLRAR